MVSKPTQRALAKRSTLRSSQFRQSGWAGVPGGGERHAERGVNYARVNSVKAAGQGSLAGNGQDVGCRNNKT